MAHRDACREALAKIGRADVPPEVMEAAMYLQYGSLSHLDRATFRREAKIAAGMWDDDREACQRLAESYGLTPTNPEGDEPMSKKHPTAKPATESTEKITKAAHSAPQAATEAPTAAIAPESKRRGRPTRSAPQAGPNGPRDATEPSPAPTQTDEASELVVFAFRLTRTERDLIHAAAGSAKASRFVRGLAVAAARGDVKAIEALVAETMTR